VWSVGSFLGSFGARWLSGEASVEPIGEAHRQALSTYVDLIHSICPPDQGKISFVADWLSGKNGFGYFTPGISITLPHSGLFNAGYSLGNDSYDGNKNRALFLYYGITLPGS